MLIWGGFLIRNMAVIVTSYLVFALILVIYGAQV